MSVTGTRSERYVDDRAKLRYYRLEVYFGSFERDVLLPADISVDRNRLGATYRDGFLIVTLPKSDDVPASRYIPIEEQSDE